MVVGVSNVIMHMTVQYECTAQLRRRRREEAWVLTSRVVHSNDAFVREVVNVELAVSAAATEIQNIRQYWS